MIVMVNGDALISSQALIHGFIMLTNISLSACVCVGLLKVIVASLS